MPKIINHKKRQEEILKVAIEVFATQGFDDSNLSIIAEKCGLSRATLYQYYQNKEEIFHNALKHSTSDMFQKYTAIEWNEVSHPLKALSEIVDDIMDTAIEHKNEVSNLIVAAKSTGRDLENCVQRRTLKLQLMFRRLLRIGIRDNQVKECDVIEEVRGLIALIEAFCFQLSFFSDKNAELIRKITHQKLEVLAKQ